MPLSKIQKQMLDQEFLNEMGDISQLSTTEKGSLVGAVNENTSQLAEKVPQLSINSYESKRIAIAEGWDYTPAFQDAIADMKETGKILVLNEDEEYYITSELKYNLQRFKIVGNNSVIKSLTPAGKAVFNIEGTLGTELPILADITEGETTFTLSATDASTLQVGDYVKISSNENYFVVADRDYKKGEIVKVKSVDGETGVVTIDGYGFNLDYKQSENNLRAQKMNLVERVEISDVRFVGKGTDQSQIGIKIGVTRKVKLNRNELSDFESGVSITSVISGSINENFIHDCFKEGTGYGVVIGGSSRHINVHSNQFENNRHSFTTGGYDGVCMHISVKHNQCKYDKNAALNTHGNARFVDFDNNNITQCEIGISSYSPYTRVKSNTFDNIFKSAIYTTEGGGINLDIHNNEINYSGKDYFNAINVGVSATTHEINKFVKVDRNTINVCANGGAIYMDAKDPQRVTVNNNDIYNIGYVGIDIKSGEQIQTIDNLIFVSRRSGLYAVRIKGTVSSSLSSESSVYGSTATIKGNQIARYGYGISVDDIDTLILGDNILNVSDSYKYTLANITTLLGGEVLKSPDGSLKRLSVDDAGAVTGVVI